MNTTPIEFNDLAQLWTGIVTVPGGFFREPVRACSFLYELNASSDNENFKEVEKLASLGERAPTRKYKQHGKGQTSP